MNFINQYVNLLMEHPLTTPIASLGLLALALHLILPLVCEIWRYYPNKITGEESIKNWYTSKIETKVWRSQYIDYVGCCYWSDFDNEEDAKIFTENHNKDHNCIYKGERSYQLHTEDNLLSIATTIFIYSVAATLTSLLLEYLLANFFIYTLVAGLAVGLHFTVILLGKKVYSISEDVKTLKEAGNKENIKSDVTKEKE